MPYTIIIQLFKPFFLWAFLVVGSDKRRQMFEEKIKCSFSQWTAEIFWVLNVNVNCGSFPPAWKTTKTFLTFLLNKVLLGLHKKCHTKAMDHHSHVMFMHAREHHLLHSTYSDLDLLLSAFLLLYICCLIHITNI